VKARISSFRKTHVWGENRVAENCFSLLPNISKFDGIAFLSVNVLLRLSKAKPNRYEA
jgi:hypothetical protein